MKVKVLFFVSTLERGGPSNIIYNIIKYLDRNVIEPSILTLSPEPDKSMISEFENLGVQIYTFQKSRLWWMFSNMKKLKSLVNQISPDIIHSHSLRPDASSAKHLGTYIRMATIHGILHINYTHTYGPLIGSYFASKQMKGIKKLDYIVACSRSIYNAYKPCLKNFSCIQNGVDVDHYHPASDTQRKLKRIELNLPLDKNIIVTVGSLTKLKDPETIIKAFDKSEQGTSVLLIIGTGPLEKTLKANRRSSQNILFKGFVTNVNDYLQCADLYVSASTSEGLPNAVLEALASGLPVCLSDIPPHREILTIEPNAGGLFKCHDEYGLADLLKKILNSELTSMREHAYAIIKKNLNAEMMSLSYQKLYVSLHQTGRSKYYQLNDAL